MNLSISPKVERMRLISLLYGVVSTLAGVSALTVDFTGCSRAKALITVVLFMTVPPFVCLFCTFIIDYLKMKVNGAVGRPFPPLANMVCRLPAHSPGGRKTARCAGRNAVSLYFLNLLKNNRKNLY
jgi:hypothetical protein